MNLKKIAVAAFATLVGTVAMARDGQADGGDVSKYLPMPVSRAEVIADLDIYRRSGLAELDRAESPDVYGNAYIGAQARYTVLRASPDFKTLVAKIARERGEAVATASTGSGAAVQ
jgi:hypothetical protein